MRGFPKGGAPLCVVADEGVTGEKPHRKGFSSRAVFWSLFVRTKSDPGFGGGAPARFRKETYFFPTRQAIHESQPIGQMRWHSTIKKMNGKKVPCLPPTLGLYIHIPFCKSKCIYCDFYSLAGAEGAMDRYVSALIRQLEELAPRCRANPVDTVYFGGGTPSYLGVKRLKKIVKAVFHGYQVTKDPEITLEANPDSLADKRMVSALRRAGINRISLGVQSADDGELRTIGRVHTFAQA